MTFATPALPSRSLHFNPQLKRNRTDKLFTSIAALFSVIAVLPLLLVLVYVLIQGGKLISVSLFTQLPPAPGLEGGGIANAIIGTFVVTLVASLIAIPVGVGGGIFLAEYSSSGWFAQFIRVGNDILAGVPSIICGVFVYSAIVATRLFFGQSYSALAGGIALAVLMLPTVIKTTDEALKLVPQELSWGAIGVGASKFVTITRITLPSAFTPIATGVVLAIARAAGETAPLIFTALFSPFWPEGLLNPIASMSVLIFNFAIMPYEAQNSLAWAASFVLVMLILGANLLARFIRRFASS
ncbi:phosphate ABC transporter permease PstA [Synechococcus sp. Cruz-9H2]|uniref:phosphate ABC transporter permease PstA n=1 Tax=unclassified Synechococcus TaxID=2626047 RepID=UPI0020CCD939|nr:MULTISPECIES: phosphate ABC transporter permease PstA [unclassified Synechococcus]MCP9818014.1 phosphate ABC transporter permease PstA [Synechococcus sp. Cruz-9H2]MCP9842486.1 phosphate ABC transporter permease PstA [Synechococcus sp. Edmonson 11F2]MCP9854410.1 phosphate ABC transporter permease PstA [Synechococcus sp. Cruz-9C9]MCP9861894.1 phosphate ABC transporter permease PstA [Synechococcus sp. Cruz-7E5]MCP9868922.1 phosphate ABC transporter permease PstA [Synechococcus sp. Cruz-7B9]